LSFENLNAVDWELLLVNVVEHVAHRFGIEPDLFR
jgi:hypothetical protein